jgi:nucleotide-binding universal stress UspA family protein
MEKKITNILIVTNFSASCKNAVETAIAMCKRHDSALHLLVIRKPNTVPFPPGKNARLIADILKSYVDQQKTLQSQAKAIQEKHNISCFYHLVNGPFGEGIASTAENFKCDLVILEKPAADLFNITRSNNLYRILKYLNQPVLTVPSKNSRIDFKRILIPVRPYFSDLEKLDIALPILQKNNSNVTIMGAIAAQTATADALFMEKLLQTACHLIDRDNIQVEKETYVIKDLAKEVLFIAGEKKSDMIVISRKFRPGLAGLLHSSYSERVISASTVPVLSVKLH